jgi:hypothetical protein
MLAMFALVAAACAHAPTERMAAGPPPPRAEVDHTVLPAGTAIVARVDRRLGTDVSRAGDRFTATVVTRIVDERGRVILPEGAELIGRVTGAEHGVGGVPPRLELRIFAVRSSCAVRPIDARLLYAEDIDANRRPPGNPVPTATLGAAWLGTVLMWTPGMLLGYTLGLPGGAAAEAKTYVIDTRVPEGAHVVVGLVRPFAAVELARAARSCFIGT